jgi:hypothetical protein
VGKDWKPKEDVLELKQKKLKDPLLVLPLPAPAALMKCGEAKSNSMIFMERANALTFIKDKEVMILCV